MDFNRFTSLIESRDKMKKTVLLMTTTASVALLFAAPIFSQAADTKSESTITFEEDGGTGVGPIDPTDPTNPVDPDPSDPNPVVPTTGPLRIDYISNIHFGKQKLTGTDKTYFAAYDKVVEKGNASNEITVPSYVQVSDDRGTNTGWTLTVSNTQFNNGTADLDGTVLRLEQPSINSTNLGKADPSVVTPQIVLDGNGVASNVLVAAANEGIGTWTDMFGLAPTNGETENKAVSLEVPGVSQKVKDTKYTSELTWTLTATP